MVKIPQPQKYSDSVSTITPAKGQDAGTPKSVETKAGGKS